MFKRLIFLTSFILVLALVSTNVAFGDFIEIPVAVGSDDAEEDVGGSAGFAIDLTSTDLEFMYDNDVSDPLDEQVVGIRFVDVQIPKGETILSASVRFDADDVDDPEHVGEAYVIIEGELSPNPGTFEDTLNNITARPRTAAQVAWGPEHWSEAHAKYFTPDLAGIIQEIVNQDGWVAGNALVLILSQDPANASTGVLEAESFTDNETDNIDRRATLIIEFGEALVVDEILREAESADVLGASWRVPVDPSASGAQYIGSENGDGNDNNTAPGAEWVAVYNFDAAGGDYKILFRGLENDSDSFWVRITTATSLNDVEDPDQPGTGWVRFNGFDAQNEWKWDEVHSDEHGNTVAIWTLEAGAHTLEIAKREDGVKLDGFIITNNLYLDQATLPDKINPPPIAFVPIPEDGAVEVDAVTLEWLPADVAVSHKVYLSEDETIDDADLAGETAVALIAPAMEPGTTYYWRVDTVEADGTVNEGFVWTFATLALEAHFPSPADGAMDVAVDGTQLSWTAGKGAILHDLYFGTDEAAIAASDMSTFQGKMMATSFDPGKLEPFTTYYWKVDEFAGFTTNPGPVWSFDTTKYLVISDDEVTLDYDNSAEPFLSEVALDTPADLTKGGVSELTLRIHGGPGPEGSASFDEATGTYTITGSGADIWGSADQFHYAYRELTGDAEITARVVDNGTGTNAWAKGGVMIRQSLEPGSINVCGFITGGSGDGGTFQWRPVKDDSSSSNRTLTGIAPPYYVRLVRAGNTFTCYMSADGVVWAQEGAEPQTIEMTDPVLIGLAVTSHQAGEKRTFVFDNVDIVGNISADEASTDIGIPFNTPEPVYVALEDSSGAVAAVAHANPEATRIDQWRDWTIPLSEFAGVDLTAAAKLYIGVGDVANPMPGGSGSIRVDDIRVVKAAAVPVGHWKLDDGEGTIAVDSSGNGNDGTLIGDPLWTTGVLDGALDFDGDGDYVDCGNDPLFDITGEITVAAWLNIRSIPNAWTGAVVKGENAWRLSNVNMDPRFHFGITIWSAPDLDSVDGATAVGFDEWHHVTGSFDGANINVYLDGVLDGSNPTTEPLGISTTNLFIGENSESPGRSWDGLIDEVKIFDRALSANEISELASVNLLANGGFEDGVIEPWGFWGDATAEVVTELVGAAVLEFPIEGGSCLHMTVNSAGANNWDYGLNQGGHVFEAGKQYTVSAFLKCKEGTLDIRIKPERGESPWEGYGDQVFTMTDTWTEYSVTTPVFTEDVSVASITFHTAFAAGDFWVDDVRFVEVE